MMSPGSDEKSVVILERVQATREFNIGALLSVIAVRRQVGPVR